jgi:imidazolonepropionase-like amidohydrolase
VNDPQPVTALVGATLIDGLGGTPIRDSVVTIAGDRIVEVGTRSSVALDRPAEVIDLTGRFLLPGLIDVHVHYFEWMGDLFLAHGVTTVKDVGNDLEWIASTRDQIEAGSANGPRIYFTGNGLDTPPPRRDHFIGIENEEMARRVVRILHEGGAMAIKIRETMQVDLLRPIVDEAHRCGIKVTGHLRSMGAAEAGEAGIDGLEHAAGLVQSTLDSWLKIDLDTLEKADVYAKYVAERKSFSLIPRGRGEAVVKELANRDVALIPTMSGWWRMASERRHRFRDEDARFANDPTLAYVPEMARSIWSTSQLYDVPDPDDQAALLRGYDLVRHFLRFHTEHGGRVLGGSDTFVGVPGLSTQRELLFFVDTGYTPLEAITMTTIDNARFMDLEDDLGSVEPGKLADLLVLDADPLASIDNIARVSAVFRGGVAVDLDGPSHPRMPAARPEMVRPLQVERRLIADGYRFSSPSFENPHEHEPVTGGCC